MTKGQLLSVADLGGVPSVPWNPPFGFSYSRILWKSEPTAR